MRAAVAAAVAALAALAGCGDDSPSTSLRLVATNSFVGRATFTLECEPAGGDVPRPAAACAALARDPDALRRPEPFVCFGGTSSWWEISITGRYDGDPVDVRTNTCWTSQMELIRALGIGQEIQRHVDPLSRPAYPGSGIPRAELAETVELPEAAPGWVVRIARLEARRLRDPRPDRLRIEAAEATYVITIEGDFVCERCPGGTASRVEIAVGKATRRIDSILVS
jgi:hypothetical protein